MNCELCKETVDENDGFTTLALLKRGEDRYSTDAVCYSCYVSFEFWKAGRKALVKKRKKEKELFEKLANQ